MKYCENCGRQCGDDERFCRACGTPLVEAFDSPKNVDAPDQNAGQATAAAGDQGQNDFNRQFGNDAPTAQPSGQPLMNEKPNDPRQYGAQTFGEQPVGRSYSDRPVNSQPFNGQPVNGQPVDAPFNQQQYNQPYGNVPPYNGSVPPYYNNDVPPYYRQNAGYYASHPYVSPQNPNKGTATASLVLGILGIVFCSAGIGLILSIIGLVLGVKSMKGYQKDEPGRGTAVAGFVCSIVGLVFSLYVIFVVWGVLISSSAYYR